MNSQYRIPQTGVISSNLMNHWLLINVTKNNQMKNQVITINSDSNMDLYATVNGVEYESTKMFSGDLVNITAANLNQVNGTKCIV